MKTKDNVKKISKLPKHIERECLKLSGIITMNLMEDDFSMLLKIKMELLQEALNIVLKK